jgi:ribosomal protein S12
MEPLFVNPRSSEDLAAAIHCLERSPVRRGQLARAARHRARRYSSALQAAAMVQIYAEVMHMENAFAGTV